MLCNSDRLTLVIDEILLSTCDYCDIIPILANVNKFSINSVSFIVLKEYFLSLIL
jgi:hypothetical protein